MSGGYLPKLFQAAALSGAALSSSAQAQDVDVHLTAGRQDHGITLYGHTIQPFLNGGINPYHVNNGFQEWNGIRDNLDSLFAGHAEQDLSLEQLCRGVHQASVHHGAKAEEHSFALAGALEDVVYTNHAVFSFVHEYGGGSMSVNYALSEALSGENGAAYSSLLNIYDGQAEGQAFVQQAYQHTANAQMTSMLHGAAMQTPETCGPNGQTFSSATNLSP